MASRLVGRAGGGLLLVVLLAAPLVLSDFGLSVATTALISAIFAVGLNLLLGHTGLPSLGHAAFFGMGAYATALLRIHGMGPWVAAGLGVLATLVFALVLSRVLLRTRGLYFLMATLAVGEIMRNVAISWRSFTGGDDGIAGLLRPTLFGLSLEDPRAFYLFVFVVLVVVLAVMWLLSRSPYGNALHAVRDNRLRTSVLGINPFPLELSAMVISAFVAGVAGTLFTFHNGFVAPVVLSLEVSGNALLMVILGGPATLFGPVVGAVVIEGIRGFGSLWTDRWLTLLGTVYVLVSLGVVQRLRDAVTGGLARRPGVIPGEAPPEPEDPQNGLRRRVAVDAEEG